jgi:hypothetical protein
MNSLDDETKIPSRAKQKPEDVAEQIRLINLDMIMAILSSNTLQTSDMDLVLDILSKATEDLRFPWQVSKNEVYKLVCRLLRESSIEIQGAFFNNLIGKSASYPFVTICFVYDFRLFELPLVYDVPAIRDCLKIAAGKDSTE